MGYGSKNIFEFTGHLFSHKNYLPQAFVESDAFKTNDRRDEILKFAEEKYQSACWKFLDIIRDMKSENLSFRPVKVRIGSEEVKSPLSDFFRSMSLFQRCFEVSDIKRLTIPSATYNFMHQRIIALGDSGNVMPHIPRKNPFEYSDEHDRQHNEIVIFQFDD